jgi:hypothetical protein
MTFCVQRLGYNRQKTAALLVQRRQLIYNSLIEREQLMTNEPASELNIRLSTSFQNVVTCVQSSDLTPPSQWPSCFVQLTMRGVANDIEIRTLPG